MLPLIPALVLAFVSFAASVFVILRIIAPILPPHPLSKRVSPAEFGLPTFRSLSPADKGHVWLACLDLLALGLFIWQAVSESTGGPSGFADASDPGASVRIWLVLTVRQNCLLIIAALTLLHVRMGRSISFGTKHWMLWSPTLVLILVSTAMAGVISGAGARTLFVGLVSYSTAVGVLSTVMFGCLIGTLFNIKKNLTTLDDENEPWPPVRQVEDKPRASFATEDVDALRDGASWLSSNASASSRRNSISAWSFSTNHTAAASSLHGQGGRPQTAAHSSAPPKSSFWFGSTTTASTPDIPPVPPLPSPYGPLSPTAETLMDPDPFRKSAPSPGPGPAFPRDRLGSQTSWLTSSAGSHTVMTAWSFPTTQHEGSVRNASRASLADINTRLTGGHSRPATPAMAGAQVLGGYASGFAPGSPHAEEGLAGLATAGEAPVDITARPVLGWSFMIWLPLGFSLPYLFTVLQDGPASVAEETLFVLSVTLSSPLLALNILLGSPLPIPTGLFDTRKNIRRSPASSDPPSYKWSHEYKRSMSTSVTVVEGRRSGDVWIAKGDAVDGKTKLSRAIGMLNPIPKLSVLPPEEKDEALFSPALPVQEDSSLPVSIHNMTNSENSAQFERMRTESKASSRYSGAEDMASRIMVAQRHYSALAQTIEVPGTLSAPCSKRDSKLKVGNSLISTATGVITISNSARNSAHLRSRSVSSITTSKDSSASRETNISPPPSFPLPPTPPNVRAARLAQLSHKKSFSSGFSFGPVDNINEIDALTAGLLPLLVPGLKVGEEMRIVEGEWTPPATWSKNKEGKFVGEKRLTEFGVDFASPEIHSTPARKRAQTGNEVVHKRGHFSLPSLGLGKDGIHSLATEIRGVLEAQNKQHALVPSNVESGWRNTVFGSESIPNLNPKLLPVREDEEITNSTPQNIGRSMSKRSLGVRPDVPHSVDTSRVSIYSTNVGMPASAASTVTLFDDVEVGLKGEPQAESTPHNSLSGTSHAMPKNRRSSIVYIKSDDQTPIVNPASVTAEPARSTTASASQWSTRAARPLVPKGSRLRDKTSKAANNQQSSTKSSSPKGGIRQLSLLEDHNANTDSNSRGAIIGGIRPLTLGKKSSRAVVRPSEDENTRPGSSDSGKGKKNLKPLQLARSDTARMRGILRKTEVLPNVVVRPPSSDTTGYAY